MENTDAASVELMTEPTSIPSQKEKCSTFQQNSPVSAAVSTMPTVDRSSERFSTGRAVFQLVPKPP